MKTILLQRELLPEAISLLQKEFPQYQYLYSFEKKAGFPSKGEWENVEILFGDSLTSEQLAEAPSLRWVHSPTPNLLRLCLPEIIRQGYIIVTVDDSQNVVQISEYVASVILAFAKNLFFWHTAQGTAAAVWEAPARAGTWSLQNRIILQIGLDKAGVAIAKRCKGLGMIVWGAEPHHSFHPYINRVCGLEDLLTVIPQADVVCVALPQNSKYANCFGGKEILMMREDSILIIIGPQAILDEDALVEKMQKGHLRGLAIDKIRPYTLRPRSPLWAMNNILITPEISPLPTSLLQSMQESFRLFRSNLRFFTAKDLDSMQNRLEGR